MKVQLEQCLAELPLVAILRGIRSEECGEVANALYAEGFRIIEVPLNSPDPFRSIGILSQAFKSRAVIGAGTVLKKDHVKELCDAGGTLCVMPHANPELIREAKRFGLDCIPGVSTPTEAFAALDAGADALKVFPAELVTPLVLKAWKAVLPEGTLLFPVGGITPELIKSYVEAGADGFGLGSALYLPVMAADEVSLKAKDFREAWSKL